MWHACGFCFSDDLYQIASPEGNVIAITAPAGYKTSYGYNAQWLLETITDTYNTTATTPWHRYATGPTKTAKADNKPITSTATKSAICMR